MNKDYLKQFCKAASVRAVKTFCQALLGAIGTTATFGGLDWGMSFSMAGMAAVCSIVTSIAIGLPEVKMPELPEDDNV